MSRTAVERWAGDTEFEDSTITKVIRGKSGWDITKGDGWSFWVPGDSPVTPTEGMAIRMYGHGIGYRVRGLFLDGQCVFYRTEAEDDQHSAEQTYGKDAAEVVARWDEGRSIWSIEMGGLGPGYEQSLQTAMIEFLRHLVAGGSIDETDGLSERLSPLGLSGAQWGAAKSLAACFHENGPQATIKMVKDDRRIQVSKRFPTIDPDILAVIAKRAG